MKTFIMIGLLSVHFHPDPSTCLSSTERNGTSASTNFPSSYENNFNCSYLISVQEANSLRIIFQQFDTEHYYDYLYVGEGVIPNKDDALASWDGSETPSSFALQSSSMWFLFVTNENVTYSGFSFSWETFQGRYIYRIVKQ